MFFSMYICFLYILKYHNIESLNKHCECFLIKTDDDFRNVLAIKIVKGNHDCRIAISMIHKIYLCYFRY